MSDVNAAATAPKKRAAQVKDVARAAGVSVATVSRAFNFPDAVSEDSRKIVLEVARTLGYSPNPAAKALRLQRSHMVGAIFPTTDYGFYAQVLGSFQHRMSASGYLSVLLTVGFDNGNIYEPVRKLVERGVEGLMVVGRIDDRRLLSYLLDKHIPVVSIYSSLKDAPFPSVGINNYAATTQVMEHLLGLGHREFAMLSGPLQGNDRQQARRKAFVDALVRAGISGEPRVFEDPRTYSIRYGTETFRRLMQMHPEVTAVVCNSDSYGVAAILEAKRLGLHVPNDVSITGFDDQELSSLVDPPLTTVSVPSLEMGTHAALTLLETLEHGRPGLALELAAPLVIRTSTGLRRHTSVTQG
ncbi:MAG: LacI family transcriptional regulator [Alcaligenaceae bacterium]|nr:MAG: LacI family transcriptional regulator [Alcaligenaceae bacterium]